MNYQNLCKTALWYMYLSTAISTLIVILILTIPFVIFNDLEFVKIIYLVLVVISLLNTTISPIFRFKRYRYAINEEQIDTIEGYLFITRQIVPIKRLHKITIEKGPIENAFRLSHVSVVTAGGDVDIKYLPQETADRIADSLRKIINELSDEKKGDENV